MSWSEKETILSMFNDNPNAPWRTQWYEFDNGEEAWNKSEKIARQYWFDIEAPHRRAMTTEHYQVAIEQFKNQYHGELTEALVCHSISETPSLIDYPGTVRELADEAMTVPKNPEGLWPVERQLAKMATFFLRISREDLNLNDPINIFPEYEGLVSPYRS